MLVQAAKEQVNGAVQQNGSHLSTSAVKAQAAASGPAHSAAKGPAMQSPAPAPAAAAPARKASKPRLGYRCNVLPMYCLQTCVCSTVNCPTDVDACSS